MQNPYQIIQPCVKNLTNAWAYYLYHREEIESQITENKAA